MLDLGFRVLDLGCRSSCFGNTSRHPSGEMDDITNLIKHGPCAVKTHFPRQHTRPGRVYLYIYINIYIYIYTHTHVYIYIYTHNTQKQHQFKHHFCPSCSRFREVVLSGQRHGGHIRTPRTLRRSFQCWEDDIKRIAVGIIWGEYVISYYFKLCYIMLCYFMVSYLNQ